MGGKTALAALDGGLGDGLSPVKEGLDTTDLDSVDIDVMRDVQLPTMETFLHQEGVGPEFLLLTLINSRTASKQGVLASKLLTETLIAGQVEEEQIDANMVDMITTYAQRRCANVYGQPIIKGGYLLSPGVEHGVGMLTFDLIVPALQCTNSTKRERVAQFMDSVKELSQIIVNMRKVEKTDTLYVTISQSGDNIWDTGGDQHVRVAFNVFGTILQHYKFTSDIKASVKFLRDYHTSCDTYGVKTIPKGAPARHEITDEQSITQTAHKINALNSLKTLSGIYDYLFEDGNPQKHSSAFVNHQLIQINFSSLEGSVTSTTNHGDPPMHTEEAVPITRYTNGVYINMKTKTSMI